MYWIEPKNPWGLWAMWILEENHSIVIEILNLLYAQFVYTLLNFTKDHFLSLSGQFSELENPFCLVR